MTLLKEVRDDLGKIKIHNWSKMAKDREARKQLLYMFRAIMCPSSGEFTVSMRHWSAGWDERLIPTSRPDSHPHRVKNTSVA